MGTSDRGSGILLFMANTAPWVEAAAPPNADRKTAAAEPRPLIKRGSKMELMVEFVVVVVAAERFVVCVFVGIIVCD